jgi:hypothetical protein
LNTILFPTQVKQDIANLETIQEKAPRGKAHPSEYLISGIAKPDPWWEKMVTLIKVNNTGITIYPRQIYPKPYARLTMVIVR